MSKRNDGTSFALIGVVSMKKSTIGYNRFASDGACLGLCILGNLNEKISPRKVSPRNHQRWAIIVWIHMLFGLRVEVDLQ